MGKENINIKYEHQNNSNYLVIEDNVEYDDYQYKMLRRNKPEHFLRFSMYSVNGRYGIYYDITSRQQLSKYYEYGKMTEKTVTKKEVVPDVTAQIFWLKNRKPEKWRDKPEYEDHSAIDKLDEIIKGLKHNADNPK